MTFRQAKELGAHVRKGEKARLSSMPTPSPATKPTRPPARNRNKQIPFMKGYTVFNVEQIEGLPAHYYAKAEPRLNPDQRLDQAESFFAALGADIRHGGNRAFYCPRSGSGADAGLRELPRRA